MVIALDSKDDDIEQRKLDRLGTQITLTTI